MQQDTTSQTPTSKLATSLVLFSVLSIGIGQSMTFALLAPLGREAGLREIEVGVIISCAALSYTLMSPFWGRICDRYGRKPILLLGMSGYVFGSSLFATMFLLSFKGCFSGLIMFAAIIMSRILMAVLMCAAPSAAAAYIADTTSAAQRVSGMGKLGAARTMGAILGPVLSGSLAVFGLLAPLYIAAGITLASTVLIALTLKEPQRPQHKGKRTAVKLQWLDPRFRPYLLVGFLSFISFSMMNQTIGFYLQDRFALSGQQTAQALGTGMVCSALTTFFAQSFLVSRFSLKPMQLMRCGLPLLICGYAILPHLGSMPLVFTVMGLLGLGLGLISPAFTGGASLAVNADEQGALGGIISACPAAGFVLGPLTGTALYQLNSNFPYYGASLLLVPLTLYIWRLGNRYH